VAAAIKNTQYADEVVKMVDDSYAIGKTWSEAFVKFMNYFIADCGFIFISAEKFREHGLFAEFAGKELNNMGQSAKIVSQTNEELESLGYHVQAQVSEINLFYHRKNIRENITPDNLDIYKELFKDEPNSFSPKVLLRPLMQDAILPTIAYIAGPGELAYLAQLNKLYNYYNIIMPRIILRHSVTILDNRSLRFMEKYDINPEIFKSHQDEFMQIIPKYLFDDETELAFLNSELKLKQIYDELSGHIIEIDKNLEKSMASAYIKSVEQLTHIRKKAISSQKKSNEEFIARFMQIRNLLLPNGKLQERVFGILNFVAIAGVDEVKSKLNNLP
jgi:bacillithiol biosynthesis cysteine-adding enzyme BshC